jgi:hypothetical protein
MMASSSNRLTLKTGYWFPSPFRLSNKCELRVRPIDRSQGQVRHSAITQYAGLSAVVVKRKLYTPDQGKRFRARQTRRWLLFQ